jgi:hypothetical protein
MRRFLAITGLLVALPLGAAPALAFQETPLPPPADAQQEAPRAKSPPMPPAMQLGTPADATTPDDESAGLFGLGLLPKLNPFRKLNFGLDVLYGEKQQQQDPQQQGSKTDESGDVSVLGKVKRRF